MDKTSLVEDDIARGRRFVGALRAAGLPVAAAMWFRKALSDRWSLGIASPDVQAHGPLSVIRFSEAVRRAQPEPTIARDDLYHFNTSAAFWQDIARFPTRIDGDAPVVESLTLNGMDVERAVVLWIDRAATPSQRPPVFGSGEARGPRAPVTAESVAGH